MSSEAGGTDAETKGAAAFADHRAELRLWLRLYASVQAGMFEELRA